MASVTSNFDDAASARSPSSASAGQVASSDASPSAGIASGATSYAASPGTRRTSRVVVSTRSPSARCSSYEAAWRTEHPGEEPGPRLREVWDRRAWSEARSDKVSPTDGQEFVARWNSELA